MNVNASLTHDIRPASSTTVPPQDEAARVRTPAPQTLEEVASAVASDSRLAPAAYCKESVAPFGGE